MQLFRTQIASSQPLTIVGGFIGSLVFISLLTVWIIKNKKMNFYFFLVFKAISNFEMNTFGPNYQARIFPEGKKYLTLKNEFSFWKNNFYFSGYLFIYFNDMFRICSSSLCDNLVRNIEPAEARVPRNGNLLGFLVLAFLKPRFLFLGTRNSQ